MKNDLSSHVCHISNPSSSSDKHDTCSTLSLSIENDICTLKKSVDCLGSILSQCAMNHKKLESMFHKKQAPYIQAHHTGIHMLIMLTHMISYMLMYTLVHIADVRATLQSFVMIEYIM